MKNKMAAPLAALAVAGIAATTLALTVPASAHGGSHTTVSAGNGTVGVNQVVTATYEYPNGDYPTCWDPRSGVRFDFTLNNGTDLGSADASCSGTSTWTATVNWSPSASGSVTITASAIEPNLGGSGAQLGQASKRVSIAGAKPAPAPAPAASPSSPRKLRVTGVSNNTVSLNWDTPSSSGASPISGYIVRWAGPTSGQVVAQATNANIGTLSPNSTYTFSVSAANANGWSDWVNVTQRTANAPTPAPARQQLLVGPMWTGGGPKVKSGKWRTFNNTQNLDTNAGHEARLSATNRSSSVKSVSFRYNGDQAQVLAVLKPGAKNGTFTLLEYSPAFPGFTAMAMTRVIKVAK